VNKIIFLLFLVIWLFYCVRTQNQIRWCNNQLKSKIVIKLWVEWVSGSFVNESHILFNSVGHLCI
jgi:hypothetical protein